MQIRSPLAACLSPIIYLCGRETETCFILHPMKNLHIAFHTFFFLSLSTDKKLWGNLTKSC